MKIIDAISSFLDHLRYQKRSSVHTIIAYETDLYEFRDAMETEMGIQALEEVRSRIISSHIATLADKGLAPSSLNRKISSIQSFFKYCQKQDWVANNPASSIKRPKMPKRLPEIVRADDLTELIDGPLFPDDYAGKRDRLMLMLLYAGGLRRDELINIQPLDINESDHTIKVTGKRNKQRVIPVSPQVISAIQEFTSEREKLPPTDDFLLLTAKGKKLYPGLVYQTVKNYLSLITTMQKRSPHVLRHSFATHLLDRGSNLQAIKELLGHSSLAATQVYTHASLEKLKDVYKNAHPKSKKNIK